MFDVDSRIIDVDTLEESCRSRRDHVLRASGHAGLLESPVDTGASFVEIDGKRFFRTGDLGYYDEDGYFFMVDRVKRMINASGFKV